MRSIFAVFLCLSIGITSAQSVSKISDKTKNFKKMDGYFTYWWDATNGKIITTVPIGEGCDGAAFDPTSKLIFTSNGSGTVSIVKELSANEYKLVETVTTKKGARTISLDTKTHMVYLPTADYEALPADAPKGARAKMIPGSFQVLVLAPSKK